MSVSRIDIERRKEIRMAEIMRERQRKKMEQRVAEHYTCSADVKQSLLDAVKYLSSVLQDKSQESRDKNGLIHFLSLSKRVCDLEDSLAKLKQREKRLKKQIKKMKNKRKGNKNEQSY